METKHTIGIGIIGLGWMGMTHARAYQQIADRFHDTPLQPKLIICADDVVQRTTMYKRPSKLHGRKIVGFISNNKTGIILC
ncbi:hypothetical protein F4054_03310 [Candidatus Poribacteria bacterium]|nr:hypothetical protein [Candidatus Poribacteria bacterium]MYK21273.1 hypothetical protein [Candidatus Poribacteria bacterium]